MNSFYEIEQARHLAGELAREMRIRALSDEALSAFVFEANNFDAYSAEEGKFEVNEWASNEVDLYVAYHEQHRREVAADEAAARARYITAPLTHQPFAGLALA